MDKEKVQRDLHIEFQKLEKTLLEQSQKTFIEEGYSRLNQLQKILLELFKEQKNHENIDNTTSKTR
ncbi:MAG: hypothetical protein L6Q37_03680 [Bdellovibrionaceae bacterium]|nr:hypothetical protein [Pseudobdellovibrionaceae bacterium]NUM59429.1 hypothetical protein [Pseudobdellovibrionaceae bacterium]